MDQARRELLDVAGAGDAPFAERLLGRDARAVILESI